MFFSFFPKIFLLIFVVSDIPIIAADKVNDKNAPICSPIPIIDIKTGQSIVRTVWHPANTARYKVDLLLPGISFADITSDDLHKEAAIMQEKAGLSLDRPLFVVKYQRTACTYNSDCYTIKLESENCYNTDIVKCSVLIGHEVGHFVWESSPSTFLLSRNADDMHTWSRRGAFAGYFVGSISGALRRGLLTTSYTLKAITISSAILYGFSRWKASVSSSELHKEEFFCDRFAIEAFGKTPQEKIARAQAFIRYFVEDLNCSRFTLLNWLYRATSWFGNLVLTSTHPSHTERIARLQAFIEEQQEIIHQADLQRLPVGL